MDITVKFPPFGSTACTDCGAKATCQYDWGAGMRYGCAAHDPLRWPYGATMARVPQFYQSLPQFPVLATTGHLGIGWGGEHLQNVGITPPDAIGCTAGSGRT
jgi:hypothetical protein